MAVCADDLALLDLVEDALPPAIRDGLPDVEQLVVTDVVELEDYWVPLPAVDAGVAAEVFE